MKGRQIKIIIFMMSISLIGLIAIQFYWIKNAVKLENEKFDRNVAEALLITVDKIEKNEAKDLAIKKVFDIDEDVVFIGVDSMTQHTMIEVEDDDSFVWNYSIHPNSKIEVKSSGKGSNSKIFVNVESETEDDDNLKVKRHYVFEQNVDSLHERTSSVVKEVVTELRTLSEKKMIAERINKSDVLAIVKEELKNKGIDTDFNFAVKTSKPDTLLFVTKNNEDDSINKTKYKARLFPHEVFSKPNYLLVNFPNRTGYLLGSMSSVLVLSVFIILLIIFLYYQTVKMLLKQKRISEIKNDLINNITHEFKTPISTISLACEALNEPQLLSDSASVDKYTGMISDENKRLQKMVEELLNTAVFENGSFKIEKLKIDLHELIHKVYENNKIMIDKANGSFILELNAENNTLFADPLHLTNILNNLVDNAIKYSGEKPEISISTFNKNGKIIISISDNGIGIDKHQQKKIFESFYRIPTGNLHDVKGYGLGLSYVKKMIEEHNGEISINSKPKKGTTFNIELPNEQ
ncbi:MAG: sensor histidine kinase [Promethearchaeota archaeon]|jgi:two-component system phosphate regulon sensor histidine kinase PhoR